MENRCLNIIGGLLKQRPVLHGKKDAVCPFCDLGEREILKASDNGKHLWIDNKFDLYENATRTLIIDNTECKFDYSEFEPEDILGFLNFYSECYEISKAKGNKGHFLFKNCGLKSGSSVPHTHCHLTYMKDTVVESIPNSYFTGFSYSIMGHNITVPDLPITELIEFNLICETKEWDLNFSILLKEVTTKLKNKMGDSFHYNLIFDLDNKRIKVLVQYSTFITPIFLAYGYIGNLPIEYTVDYLKECRIVNEEI